MSHNHRKRKHKPPAAAGYRNYPVVEAPEPEQFLAHHQGYQPQTQSQSRPWPAADSSEIVDPLRVLYIQAHEADLVRGDTSRSAAESLEVVEYRAVLTSSGTREISVLPRIGSALIQWGTSTSTISTATTDLISSEAVDEDNSENEQIALPPSIVGSEPAIWVDRYDARLLLDALPLNTSSKANSYNTTNTPSLRPSLHRPASPSGWSDIASDAEDTFFFTPAEVEDYHREKRRRLLEQSREERLRARMQEDGVDGGAEEEDVWGGSDEEPDEAQNELMARTATHLLSSPNPAQLEMRILANHGGDRRFAFLRGRWKNTWNLAKAKARLKKKAEEKPEKPAALSNALAGYGSGSDSDNGSDESQEPPAKAPPEPSKADEVSTQELRRQRLKKWTEERRASQQQTSSK